MKRHNIRISGFGGQGIVLSGYIIGKAAAIYDDKKMQIMHMRVMPLFYRILQWKIYRVPGYLPDRIRQREVLAPRHFLQITNRIHEIAESRENVDFENHML